MCGRCVEGEWEVRGRCAGGVREEFGCLYIICMILHRFTLVMQVDELHRYE